MNPALLVNKEFEVNGNWYAPSNFLKSYASVVRVELWNTTNSGGDWDGFFVQKINKNFYVIPFWQTSKFLSRMFELNTGNIIASSKSDFTLDECYEIMQGYE